MTSETRTETRTAPPKERAARSRAGKPKGAKPAKPPVAPKPAKETTRAEAVEKILQNVETKLKSGKLRASLGDYIKLIQLSKDMKDEEKTEIKVTWIEEPET